MSSDPTLPLEAGGSARCRGRDLFLAARPILRGGAALLGLLPRWVAEALLALLRDLPGYPGLGLRYMCVRRLAASCGENVAIYAGVYMYDLDKCHLGSNIKIGEMCFIGASGGLRIASNVSLAHATTVLTEEHDYRESGPLRETSLVYLPVTIDEDVWIGAGVRVTAGVHIGRGAAVGAGSVVTHDVPPSSVVAGVPARVLKYRPGAARDGNPGEEQSAGHD